MKVMMVLENLAEVPVYPLPTGYSFRLFTPEDMDRWVDLNHAAGLFTSKRKAIKRFQQEFTDEIADLCRRCLFLLDKSNREIGTVMAWKNSHLSEGNYGRLHWVALHPDYQGIGLGKPLVSSGLSLMMRFNGKAYLTSETTRYIAINMYLDFGFKPYIKKGYPLKAWRLISDLTHHPTIQSFWLN